MMLDWILEDKIAWEDVLGKNLKISVCTMVRHIFLERRGKGGERINE